MNINKKMPYTRPDVSVRHIEVEGALLVGSPGKSLFDQSKIQSAGQQVEVHEDGQDPFKFSWE